MHTLFFDSISSTFRTADGGYANLCACDRVRHL